MFACSPAEVLSRAAGVACPACGTRVGKPCITTISMPGTSVNEGMPISGMHAERLWAFDELYAALGASS